MRNIKTHSKTMKKKLNKCKTIFYAYNELQFKYGNILEEREDVLEFKCNVRINCSLGDNYTTDFYIIKTDGTTTFLTNEKNVKNGEIDFSDVYEAAQAMQRKIQEHKNILYVGMYKALMPTAENE